jgi:hypothetical protein
MTKPQVQSYLRENVQRMTRDWGYRYLKMDGLWTGSATVQQYVNDSYKDDHMGNAVLSNPTKTNIEALRDGLKLIRESAGPDVFLLGCCAPQNMRSYGGAFGLLDAMRIGPDNGASVEGLRVGPRYGSRNYFLHGRVWWNDPDPVYVRSTLSLSQAQLSATWAAIAGQLTVAGDDLPALPAERLDILKRVMPSHGRPAKPVDLLERDLPRLWIIPAADRLQGRTVVGLFHWDKDSLQIDEPIERFGLDSKQEYSAFEFWSNRLAPPIRGRLQWTLESMETKSPTPTGKESGPMRQSCAALSIRPTVGHPQLLSTSRHVTQGLVDVVKETWDEKSHRLSGVSRVVGGDSYELRVLKRSSNSRWRLAGVQLNKADVAAGASISVDGDDADLVRATIRSTTSREATWTLQFTRLEP